MFFTIKKSDVVDIILPATSCSQSHITAIKNYVKNELDLTPRILLENEMIFAHEKAENEFPNNAAKERFLQLEKALKNSDSKIIWCARGGYGSGDLLPYLAKTQPVKQQKLFIGFSDIVSLSTFLQDQWNWSIICAPVLLQLARGDIEKAAENELKDLIFGKKSELKYELQLLNSVKNIDISAVISGGCLSVLAGHFGGNYQINFDQKILFLEDEGEDGERLDRYFRQIIEVITKTQQFPQAILLGNFMQANIHGTPKAQNIQIAIANFIKRIAAINLQIPVFKSKDDNLGHSSKMRPLILGHKSKILRVDDDYQLVNKL